MSVDIATSPCEPSLVHSLRGAAQQYANEDAFVFVSPAGDTSVTYAQLWGETESVARSLRHLGLAVGERVGLLCSDSHAFIRTFLGAMRAGLVPIPMAPAFALAELDTWLESAGNILRTGDARALVTDARDPKLETELAARAPCVEWFLSAKAMLSDVVAPLPELTDEPLTDLALLQFTSGSTGAPKGVCATHRALLANCDAIMSGVLKVKARAEVAVGWLPLYHDMGLMALFVGPIRSRCLSVVIRPVDFAKKPARWLTAASKYRGTVTFAPNFAYALVTSRPPSFDGLDLSSLRVLGCGAEPIRAETLRQFTDKFATAGLPNHALLPCYGMAESVVGISMSSVDEPMLTEWVDRGALAKGRAQLASSNDSATRALTTEVVCCGKALPGHDLEVVDEHGGPLPDRTIGEFRVRGPSLTAGYYRDPEATSATFTDAGFLTGDLGYMVDGRAYVTGRRKDLVIIAGCNYVPSDIERIVEDVAGVRAESCVAFSRSNAGTEQLVIALEARFRDYQQPHAPLIAAVKSHVQRKLALAAHDVVVLPPGALSRTSSGKLRRAETARRYECGTLSDASRTPPRPDVPSPA
jgi:fatty-acyl-CoA synthase